MNSEKFTNKLISKIKSAAGDAKYYMRHGENDKKIIAEKRNFEK